MSLLQPQGPSPFTLPAAPGALAASSGLVTTLLAHPALFRLWIAHLLCLLLQTPPPGSPLMSRFPVAVLCQQVASALSNLTPSQGVRGPLSLRGLEAQGLPCSPCDHSASRLVHSRHAMVLPTGLMDGPQGPPELPGNWAWQISPNSFSSRAASCTPRMQGRRSRGHQPSSGLSDHRIIPVDQQQVRKIRR